MILLAASGCGKNDSSANNLAAECKEGTQDYIAPQVIEPAPVVLTALPPEIIDGNLRLEFSSLEKDYPNGWMMGGHFWLDRQVNGCWETAWILPHSMSLEEFQSKQLGFTAIGLGLRNGWKLKLDPSPPPGTYRVRIGVTDSRSLDEAAGIPAKDYWATTMIEIVGNQ